MKLSFAFLLLALFRVNSASACTPVIKYGSSTAVIDSVATFMNDSSIPADLAIENVSGTFGPVVITAGNPSDPKVCQKFTYVYGFSGDCKQHGATLQKREDCSQ